MGLVYLITGLPRLRRDESAPLTRSEFVSRCLSELRDNSLAEMKRLLRLEAVEETIRLSIKAQLADPDLTTSDLQAAILQDRHSVTDLEEIPAWALQPMVQHQLMRRHYHELIQDAKTPFLREWAHFRVDLEEVKTALLCRQLGWSKERFLQQMQGSFDASAPLIIRNWEEPRLGLGNRFAWLTAVVDALAEPDILTGERAIIDVQWRKIGELPVPDLFSAETVMAFYLRLRLLEREQSWDLERGQAVLDEILNVDLVA